MISLAFSFSKKHSFLLALALVCVSPTLSAQEMEPILAFPQKGMDDPTAYRGYTTRFFRDSDGNTVQIYINWNSGRVVHLWADAANESISFTVRKTDGTLAGLDWSSRGVKTDAVAGKRTVEHSLAVQAGSIEIGHVLLSSMRKERDFQYFQKHLLPFDAPPLVDEELSDLIGNLERLPVEERKRQLTLLNAANLDALRDRLEPVVTTSMSGAQWVVSVRQPSFDGKNELWLEIRDDSSRSSVFAGKKRIAIVAKSGQHLRLTVAIGTNSASLSPLNRQEIFNDDFFRFQATVKAERDSALRLQSAGRTSKELTKLIARYEWLERNIKGAELLSSREKLMAGLPNFATYFGRDMMMSALMIEPIWKPAMLEHVIASVLRKLRADGNVSHEEALGGQAIKENADLYNKLMKEYFAAVKEGTTKRADTLLAEARTVLGDLQAVRENYMMIDDDFQLPVLAGRYLARSDVPLEQKRSFLLAASGDDESRLDRLLRNLLYVAELSALYVERPDALHLVSFPQRDGKRLPASWRDSGAGYAGGRFAMDINAIWVPKALQAMERIFAALNEMGFTADGLEKGRPALRGTKLMTYFRDPQTLKRAATIWQQSIRHFEVKLTAEQVQQRVRDKLSRLPAPERAHWSSVLETRDAGTSGIEFLALSLDERGKPIPVVNTDPATRLFLADFTQDILSEKRKSEEMMKLLKPFLIDYPVGLFVQNLGPLVANDVYASSDVWERFENDRYHSPFVVWGREVNLLLLGLSKEILSSYDKDGNVRDSSVSPYVQHLRGALEKTEKAVEASGLKHNELWTYRVENGNLLSTRFATSSDIQLWNVTDLAVRFLLEKQKGN